LKRFREPVSASDQLFLLPPSVSDFVAPDSPVRILSEVIDALDCSALYARSVGVGAPSYDPRLLLKVLVFGYWQGVRSSRKLEAALNYDVRYMFLAQMSRPDYRTIARFRVSHERAIGALFAETVRLCQSLDLVLLEHVSVDGTKLEADVSGRHTYTGKRLDETLEATEAKIAQILAEAKACDEQEDAQFGDDSGNDPPEQLRGLERRRELLQKAKEDLKKRDASCVAATDLDSRVMRTGGRNRPAYNAQAVVDSANQVIVAAAVSQDQGDHALLEPMLKEAEANTGIVAEKVSADSGYWSAEAAAYVQKAGLDAYIGVAGNEHDRKQGYEYDQEHDQFIGPNEEKLPFQCVRENRRKQYKVYRSSSSRKQLWVAQDGGMTDRMRAKLTSPEGRAVYRLRQQIVEPVFGHIKGAMNLRRLLVRGLTGATSEYMLACCAHNIQKIMPVWQQRPLQSSRA
jgi:transposase